MHLGWGKDHGMSYFATAAQEKGRMGPVPSHRSEEEAPNPVRRPGARYLSARNARTHHPDTGQPMVALTFDDGPSPFSSEVLAILQEFQARATFFLIGQEVVKYPSVARAEADVGNILGNHSYTHPYLRTLDLGEVRTQLEQTQRVLESATGAIPRWFRPPHGSIDGRVFGVAASLGLITAAWSVDPKDYERPGAEHITRHVLDHAQPGSIVLLHDGGGDRRQTMEALPEMLGALRSRGYHFATLDELYT